MMTQRVHYFLDLDLSYFYRIKGMSWIIAEYLQLTIYVKQKAMFICTQKNLPKNFPDLLIPHYVNEEVYLSYLYFTDYPVQVSVTKVQQ